MYLCKSCSRYFSVNTDYSLNREAILLDHLDGISLRRLAVKYNISKSKCQRICFEELKKLPDNNQFSIENSKNFGSVLMPDAKYINVKGHKDKLAFLWAVDYFKHDFPVISLEQSESFVAWNRFFKRYQSLGKYYPIVVCDDNIALKLAALKSFPDVRIQTCYNHLKENYRRVLKVRSQSKYRHFMLLIESFLSSESISKKEFNKRLRHTFDLYHSDPLALSVLVDLKRKEPEIHTHRLIKHTPKTTNLIESFNSQLEARLVSLRSFQSYEHARLWLNGYVLKRRFTKFTDCKGKFKEFNGKKPIEITLNEEKNLVQVFKRV